MIQEAEEKVCIVLEKLKTAQSHQKRQYDRKHKAMNFEVVEKPYVGYRDPAKPLRFELWGAHEDLLSTKTCPQPRRDSKLAR